VGIFGSVKKESVISSLGFILYQFESTTVENLNWPGYHDMQIETYEIKGKTSKVCNSYEDTKVYPMFYPTTFGN